MSAKWKKVRLGEVADCTLGKMLDQRKNSGTPREYLANVDVRWGLFDTSNLQQMKMEDSELIKYELRPGDLVMCEGGEPGRCAIWNEANRKMYIQKALFRIRAKEQLNIQYFYYWVCLYAKCGGLVQYQTGTGIRHMPLQKLVTIEFPCPDMEIQNRIVAILSDYDAAIANCRKQISLLEEAAMRLYREWFKDGKGEKKRLVDIVEVTYGYPFEGKLFNSIGKGLPIIRIRNIPLGESNDYTTEKASDRYIVRDGDILIGMDGEFYVNFWSGGDAYLVQRTCRLRPNEFKFSGYIREAIRQPIEAFQAAIVGSTVGHLGKRDIDTITITVPREDEIVELLQQGYEQQLNLRKQIRSLTEARDRLLPKLMKGEIEV